MGEAGQTAAGHVRVQWSIETVCVPRPCPERIVDRNEGFMPLVARILAAHGRDRTIRKSADLTPQTRTDFRAPSETFEPQGAEILSWIESQAARRAAAASVALALVENQAAQRAAVTRRQDLGRITRSLEAIQQESPPGPRPAYAPPPLPSQPSSGTTPRRAFVAQSPVVATTLTPGDPWLDPAFVPPRSAGRTAPTEATALWLPAAPWAGPPFTLQSEGGSGPLQRSAAPVTPVALAEQDTSDGEWM